MLVREGQRLSTVEQLLMLEFILIGIPIETKESGIVIKECV